MAMKPETRAFWWQLGFVATWPYSGIAVLGGLLWSLKELAETFDDPDPAPAEPEPPEGPDGVYIRADLFDINNRRN